MDALWVHRLDLEAPLVQRALFTLEEIAVVMVLDKHTRQSLYDDKSILVSPASKHRIRVRRIINEPKLHLQAAHMVLNDGTHVLAFSGMKDSRTLFSGGWRLPCSKTKVPFTDAVRSMGLGETHDHHKVPPGVAISKNALTFASAFTAIPEFVNTLHEVADSPRAIVCGFSFGGFFSHVFGGVLRAWRSPPARLAVVASAAPRSGNAEWADWFAEGSPSTTWTHINFVFTQGGKVDPIVCIPSTVVGFHNCKPVVFSDTSNMWFDFGNRIQKLNFMQRKSHLGACLAALKLLGGFGQMHHTAFNITPKQWWRLQDDTAQDSTDVPLPTHHTKPTT